MRIGEFAQKHGITQDTIRYYLDIGLLVAEKNGMQYKFSESDSKDLDKIMELKQLGFSLTEIQKVLTYQRVSGTNTDFFRNLYLSFLEEKRNEVSNELLKYNKMNDFLKDKIHEIKEEGLKERQKLGLPMTSLAIFACPICEHYLDVSEGTIEKNMIMEANINCQCGYKAVIRDGIYIDESTVRTKMVNGKKMLTKEEFLACSSHTYVNFIYRGMASLIQNLKRYGKAPEYILELDNCVGFFLLQYIKYLPHNATYILIDYDKERITDLKKNLEMYYDHKKFIFLCCDFHRLPIVKASMDIIIDFWMTKTYVQATGEFLPEKVLPLLKQDGIFAMTYPHCGSSYKEEPNSSSKMKEYLNKKKMMDKLADSQLTPLDVIDIGPVIEGHPYNKYGAELYQGTYVGKKRAVHQVKSKYNYINKGKNIKTWS